MKAVFIFLFLLLCMIAACSQSYIVNMNEKTNFPQGRELFISKCGGCHQLYNPNKFTAAQWDSLLFIMKRKAKIGEGQKNEIYNWIIETKEKNSKFYEAAGRPDG